MISPVLHIFTTGGTIDKVYFDARSEFQVGKTTVNDLLTEANVTLPCIVTTLMRKDSLDMTEEDRASVRSAVEKCEEERVLITHGTDTMVETGRALAGVEGKTIVLTGAMQPAALRSSDADFNIGFAVAAASLLPPGVYIAMNGQLFDPQVTHKDREAHRFVSS